MRTAVLLVIFALAGWAQTTQGVVLGQITDSVTGLAVRAARVECVNAVSSDGYGFYAVPSVSPGTYIVTVTAVGYQSQQARAVEVAVASRVELNFRLRPLSDLWEAGRFGQWRVPGSLQTLGFYGPDVDTSRMAVFTANTATSSPLETSRSDVIGQAAIDELPLTGRDVYTMLVLLPGVTADTGTGIGLGFSAFGQRPTSSEYLLDGVNNNFLLTTGPLNSTAPEFIQEYRVSIGDFSAEYGRTSGFVANAITRGASERWHGAGFFHLENELLNANGFQENASGTARHPLTQAEGGFTGGGRIIPHRLFVSGGLDLLRKKSLADAEFFALPTISFIQSTSASSYAGQLLRQYPLLDAPHGVGDAALVSIAPPADLFGSGGYARVDFQATQRDRVFARVLRNLFDQPEFVYSPYRGFSTPYRQVSLSVGGGWTRQLSPALTNDLRVARTGDSTRLETPHSEVPQLSLFASAGVTVGDTTYLVSLPGPEPGGGSNAYNYRNLGGTWEGAETLTWVGRRNLWKVGGSVLRRSTALDQGFTQGGYLLFSDLANLAAGVPVELLVESNGAAAGFAPFQPNRKYRYSQASAFVQDSLRLTRRITIDFGLRYEWYGSPFNTGAAKDTLIVPGQSLASAVAVTPAAGKDEELYRAAGLNLAPRAGLAWDVTGSGRTLVRVSYGMFYDRPFDNVWGGAVQNQARTAAFQNFGSALTAGETSASIAAAGAYTNSSQAVDGLVFQSGLRAPRVQNAFAGVQRPAGSWLFLEGDVLASRGRGLITTDIINRALSVPQTVDNPFGYINPVLGELNYRANQGKSQYVAVSGTVKVRRRTLFAQASYTWSHSQDNQSEAFNNSFFEVTQFAPRQTYAYQAFSAFTREGDSNGDWANSDFDQRHNFVFYGGWMPVLRSFRGWRVSGLLAARSGLPFSVYGTQTVGFEQGIVINERGDLLSPSQASVSRPGPGGEYLLNARAFSNPAGVVGNTGRNEFRGPGLFSADLSLSRSFAVRDVGRWTVRADVYNVLNHANLNAPDSFVGSATFGLATRGRGEAASGFPLLSPLNETARVVQILLRVDF